MPRKQNTNVIEFEKSKVFSDLENSYGKYQYTLLQGGKRCGKTYGLLMFLLYKCFTGDFKGLKIVVLRSERTRLTDTVVQDLKNILFSWGKWIDANWSESKYNYKLPNNNLLMLRGLDDETKARGISADIVWLNEATEIKRSVFDQLLGRITGLWYTDFNPTDINHWVVDLKEDDKAVTFKYTYLDNKFLTPQQLSEFEKQKDLDPDWFRVYGLGEFGINSKNIYRHQKQITDEELKQHQIIHTVIGCDYGYNDESAVVRIDITSDGRVIATELLYQRHLTTDDLVKQFYQFNINSKTKIIVDNARPDLIQQLKRNGFFAVPCVKKNGINFGINIVKSVPLFIHYKSKNLWNEINSYKWELDRNDNPVDYPASGQKDHLLDALRYAIYDQFHKPRVLSAGDFLPQRSISNNKFRFV